MDYRVPRIQRAIWLVQTVSPVPPRAPGSALKSKPIKGSLSRGTRRHSLVIALGREASVSRRDTPGVGWRSSWVGPEHRQFRERQGA